MKTTSKSTIALALLVCNTLGVSAATLNDLKDTEVTIGGYLKADLMFSNFSEGAPANNSPGRHFVAPGAFYGSDRSNTVVDFHARQSRFNIGASNTVVGHKVSGFYELDFLLHDDGNEIVSNSYSPRMRHLYVTFDDWLFGQTWTTILNLKSLPEHLDFLGVPDGTIFTRQTMVRYSTDNWTFALENPVSTFTNYNTGARITPDSNSIPDVHIRYDFKPSFGSLSLGAVLSQLDYDQANIDESEFAWAVSAAGYINIPSNSDEFRFQLNVGEGMGRYFGLNFANGAVVNDGKLETISNLSGFVSYRHWWNKEWRSNITISGVKADYDLRPITPVNESSITYNINLLYSPFKPVTLGVEFIHSENKRTDDYKVELDRVQMSVKYNF
ncbi:DcaP family trimeric outer membrane transporter [Shewanella zhangzhouensis]|uniref:DcaP family trimeric outer membrane transporter n=1 Tax=Shewanella zhangzhouensis TaxID=2864213 RepID=UPI001C657C81|nr:DcaP family trimeric outer membrane transporter [Shewanella zhangzhouensis]QYK07011.1 porin [Shewanella zhangzhouensis]